MHLQPQGVEKYCSGQGVQVGSSARDPYTINKTINNRHLLVSCLQLRLHNVFDKDFGKLINKGIVRTLAYYLKTYWFFWGNNSLKEMFDNSSKKLKEDGEI